ncbi:MAG: peptide chain release factor N(5)-glutamine methyltransferase, partial [Lachnospiraceae bacterium]|nr:peptide chain release factor N(5)-glutamine methyltransferase [Candidatus Equihabitans merdae]
ETRSIRVLDMCTGSGCLLIALALNWQDDRVSSGDATCKIEGLGADIAAGAVEAAAKNAHDLKAGNLAFIQSDLFSKVTGTYDIIISNPPYIPTKDIESLDLEVRDHEPMIALDGGEDGLDFYKRIVQEAPHYLNKGGSLLFEIGYDEGHAVQKLMMDGGFSNVKIVRDLAGLDRVVQGVYTCLNN